LGGNHIGEGAIALSEALKANRTLTVINLGNNKVGNNGAEALSETLKTNHTLTLIKLGLHPICIREIQAVDELIQRNENLRNRAMTAAQKRCL